MTLTDRYGLSLSTTSPAARDAYVAGVDCLLAAQPGAEEQFDRALAADPGFALAAIARARTLALHGRVAEAREGAASARTLAAGVGDRERRHVDTLAMSIEGRLPEALAATRAHLAEFPRDAMVLAPVTGVFGLIGFSGVRDRDDQLLAVLDSVAAHYDDDWWFPGLHAFASIEAGHVAVGRQRVERAIERNPRSANAAHVFAHACYESGSDDEGTRYLDRFLADYAHAGTLYCHLWWHVALFALARGDADLAYDTYARHCAPGVSWGPTMNTLTDSSSILWRLELAGVPRRPDAWQAVHAYARQTFPRAGIPFADAHAALACAAVGDGAALKELAADLGDASGAGKHAAAPTVAALAEGFAAFARGDFDGAIAHLAPVMDDHVRIGGSRAQRDLVEHTLLAAYVKTGRAADADRLWTRRPQRRGRVAVRAIA